MNVNAERALANVTARHLLANAIEGVKSHVISHTNLGQKKKS